MFSGFMPQRREFFDLLAAHSDRVAASANATLRIINTLGSGNDDEITLLVKEVDFNEKKR